MDFFCQVEIRGALRIESGRSQRGKDIVLEFRIAADEDTEERIKRVLDEEEALLSVTAADEDTDERIK